MADPINEADLEWQEYEEGTARFGRKRLAAHAEGERLGCSLYELDPGERAWPYHYHAANEEAMYVLAGSGRVRGPDGDSAVGAGDYLAFPTGEEGGHHVVNDGEAPLRYLMVSTMVDPDVTVYPDSGKFGVFGGAPPGGTGERTLSGYYRVGDDVDYWEGETATGTDTEGHEDGGPGGGESDGGNGDASGATDGGS
jgi:uncharacterized cupin superfamily protein